MRAVWVTRFGGPEVLVPGEAPDPVAGPGQVVVGVSVAGIDFVQTQLRAGFTPGPALPEPPYIPGGGVAGEVLAVGAGVDSGWVGQRVAAGTAGDVGAYAERALAPVESLVAVPDGLGLLEAAALRYDGSTALGLFDKAEIRAGEWVLVEAAGGGVGSLLVQLAHRAGARVVGAARGAQKLALARELGADAVVDYAEPDWAKQVLAVTGDAGPNVVFDGVGGQIGRAAFDITARGGRFSMHGAASGTPTQVDPARARWRGVTVLGFDQLAEVGANAERLAARMFAEAAADRISPVIGQTFPVERAADAHAAIEARSVLGKTLLLV